MLFDKDGNRKYMVVEEWRAFLAFADTFDPVTRTFCYALHRTGGRLTEVRRMTARSVDPVARLVVLYCLKRRKRGVYRGVPVDQAFLDLMEDTFSIAERRADPSRRDGLLWPWCRTTAWDRMKRVAISAGIPEWLCSPKAMRHTFAFEGVQEQDIDIKVMQEMLGHVRIESTLEYSSPVGPHARRLTDRMWSAERPRF